MRIIHRLSLRGADSARPKLLSLGISIREDHLHFEVDESNEKWSEVSRIAQEHSMLDYTYTKFTQSELDDARLLSMWPTWHCGYPMPDNDFGYRELTYDLSNWCRCGIGKVQKAPFRLRQEPNWGKNSIMQVHWVYDEFFVKPEVWEQVLKPFGIETIPALRYRTGLELKTVVQLKIDGIAASEVNTTSLPYERCDECGRIKYLPHKRGMFPTFLKVEENSKLVFKTREYWGSGGSAFRQIIVTHRLYQAITNANLKGVSFVPVAES